MSSIWYLKSPSADMSWTDALDQLGFESNDVYKYIYTLDNESVPDGENHY
jgi:hypothetical protein